MDVQFRDGTRSEATYRVMRVVMLVLTTLATMVVLLITPFKAEEGEFVHALRSGEISSVAVGSSADFFAGPGLRSGSYNVTDDVAVSWVSPFGFRREAVLNDLHMLDTNAETTPSLPHLDPRPPSPRPHRASEWSPPRWCDRASFRTTASRG